RSTPFHRCHYARPVTKATLTPALSLRERETDFAALSAILHQDGFEGLTRDSDHPSSPSLDDALNLYLRDRSSRSASQHQSLDHLAPPNSTRTAETLPLSLRERDGVRVAPRITSPVPTQ